MLSFPSIKKNTVRLKIIQVNLYLRCKNKNMRGVIETISISNILKVFKFSIKLTIEFSI